MTAVKRVFIVDGKPFLPLGMAVRGVLGRLRTGWRNGE